MKTAAAGEIKQRLDNDAAVINHFLQSRLNVGAVKHQQRAAVAGLIAQIRFKKTAIQTLIGKGRIVGGRNL